MTIADNRDAREAAEAMADLAVDAAQTLPNATQRRYWELLFLRVAEWAKKVGGHDHQAPPPIQGMTDRQAKNFEMELVTFGKHKGRLIGAVEMSYWEWLDDQPNFRADLRSYLLSNRVKAERDAERRGR